MLKQGARIGLLIAVIIVPLVIIFNYQRLKLRIVDTTSIKLYIVQCQEELALLRDKNQQQFQQIYQQLQQDFPQDHNLKQKTKDLVQLMMEEIDRPLAFSELQHYYKHQHILNVQVTPGFISELQTIKESIQAQFFYFFDALELIHPSYIEWRQGMVLRKVRQNLIYFVSELRLQSMDENIALKLKKGDYKNQYYLKEITEQLKSLPSFSHCKFTNQPCHQSSIVIVKHNQLKEPSYWKSDDDLYIIDEIDQVTIFNVLCEIFQLKHYFMMSQLLQDFKLPNQFLIAVQKKKIIEEFQHGGKYIGHVMQQSNFSIDLLQHKLKKDPQEALRYVKNGQFVSPYIHTFQQRARIREFLGNIHRLGRPVSKLTRKITESDTVGKIDYFPNDFKIGVYLPLLVIFLYPCAIIIKRLTRFLISSVKKTLKKDSKNTKTQNNNDLQ